MKNILTIGITTHGSHISKDIIDFLKGQPVTVIISEDKDINQNKLPDFVFELKESGTKTEYYFSERQGIANNRQNILNHVQTKYFYTIDNDDKMTGNLSELNSFLSATDFDLLYVKCYEDGKYMRVPTGFLYMCTWMQIYKTEWFRKLGGYIQSWNFIHEESVTNANMFANLGENKFKRTILHKKLLSYKYHANDACNVSFDVKQVCEFLKEIPNNALIKNKKEFVRIYKIFVQKYMPVYRINEKNEITYLSDFKNGKYEDIVELMNKM